MFEARDVVKGDRGSEVEVQLAMRSPCAYMLGNLV